MAEPVRWPEGQRREAFVRNSRSNNATLKRLLAQAELEKAAFKELAEENFSARAGAAVAYLIRTVPVSEQMAYRLVGRSRLAYRRPLTVDTVDTVADPDRALRDWLHALRVPTGVSRRAPRAGASTARRSTASGVTRACAFCNSVDANASHPQPSTRPQRTRRTWCGRWTSSSMPTSRIRNECLNINSFYSLLHAQVMIGDWNKEYNHHRRHSSLGYLPQPNMPGNEPTKSKPTTHKTSGPNQGGGPLSSEVDTIRL